MSNGGDPKLKLWSLLLLVGSGMLFLAFFMPWWGIANTYVPPPKRGDMSAEDYEKEKEDHKKKNEAVAKATKGSWYKDHIPDRVREKAAETYKDKFMDAFKEGESFTVTSRIWGWSTGVGITGFIFSFFLIAVAIVPMFVRLLQRWIWTGYFGVAVIGLVMFILSLVWYFSSPGKNVSGRLSQGVGLSPGPYLEIFGSMAVLAAGVLGGVFGLLHFLKGAKAAKAAATDAPAEPAVEGDDEFVEE